MSKARLILVILGVIAPISAVSSSAAAISTRVRPLVPPPGTCTASGTGYIDWNGTHRPPLYSLNTTQPDGCWSPIDLYTATGTNFNDCRVLNYPTVTHSIHGSGTQYAYDDTSSGHSSPDENTVIKGSLGTGTCLPSGVSHLDVEFEAAPSCGAYTDRYTGFSVGVYLRELYCNGNSIRDSISCSWGSVHGCVVNAVADVPSPYGGLCTFATATCHTNLNNDFQSACSGITSGDSIGVYGVGALIESPTDYAQVVASWINNGINTYCFYNLG